MSTATTTPAHDRAPFRKLRGTETCAACGHQGWCMASATTLWCMRNPDGAYATTTDKAGGAVYLHRATGTPLAAPLPFPRHDDRPARRAHRPRDAWRGRSSRGRGPLRARGLWRGRCPTPA